MVRKLLTVCALWSGTIATAAVAEDACYDVKVNALPVDQVPSEIGSFGGDYIIMSWPWFLDLRVKHVIDGKLESKIVRVLSVQHTYLKARSGIWLLRRNTVGGFNVLPSEDREAATLCASNVGPVDPYIQVSSEQSLDSARNAGVKAYGHHHN